MKGMFYEIEDAACCLLPSQTFELSGPVYQPQSVVAHLAKGLSNELQILGIEPGTFCIPSVCSVTGLWSFLTILVFIFINLR